MYLFLNGFNRRLSNNASIQRKTPPKSKSRTNTMTWDAYKKTQSNTHIKKKYFFYILSYTCITYINV